MGKELKTKRSITVAWWNEDDEELPQGVLEELNSHGHERANLMIGDCYTSGELHSEIDGVEYRGWWEMKEETL